MRIAIATDAPGWHGEQLRAAFAAAGVETTFFSLRACRIDTRAPQGLVIPGFEDCLPDGVFVRQVPGGTLEQVVLRLDILHALHDCGVPVCNDARAIERTVDKAMTSWLLHRAGVPTPVTWAGEGGEEACARPDGEGTVIKPLFGSRGQGLRRIDAGQPLPPAADTGGVHYAQRFVPPDADGFRDWRVFVIDGIAVAAMERRGQDWINNVAQGARCAPAAAQGPLADLAQAACAAVGAAYAGVDIMREGASGWCVIEVNGIPAWQGLQSVCEFNIAARLARSFLARC